jgi:PAS domain S-box-containing protein
VLWAISGFTQTIDSLELKLKTAPENEQAALLNKLSAFFLNESPEKARNYATRALVKARELDNNGQEAESLFNLAKAQEKLGQIDEAENNISEAERIWGRADNYDKLADLYFFSGKYYQNIQRNDKAINYYDKAAFILGKATNKTLLLQVYISRGDAYFEKEQYEKAIENYDDALTASEHAKDKKTMALAYSKLGGVYQRLSNFDKALKYYEISLKIFKILKDKTGQAEAYSNNGNIYWLLKDIKAALVFYKKSMEVAVDLPDKGTLAQAYEDIGNCYIELKRNNEAIDYYKKAGAIYESLQMSPEAANVFNTLGTIYFKAEKYPLAIEYHNKAIVDFLILKNQSGLASCYNNLAEVYVTTKFFNQAETALKNAETILGKVGTSPQHRKNALVYSIYYEALGKFEPAYNYFKKYNQINEIISYEESRKKLIELRAIHEIDQKEKEIQELKLNKKRDEALIGQKNKMLVFFIFTTIILIVAGVFIFYLFRQKKRINLELTSQRQELSEANKSLWQKNMKITEQKDNLDNALLELRKSEEKFRRLIETNSAGICIYNEHSVLYFNPVCVRLLGFSADMLSDISIEIIIHPDYRAAVFQRLQEHLNSRLSTDRFEMKILTRSQEERWIDFSTVSIEYEGQKAALATFYDITDQISAITRLQEAKTEIEEKNELILSSIQYAEKIQHAILPPEDLISGTFKSNFILYKPRDIVSGDFYWFTSKDNKALIAAADCTGHGVPGALMSMLGIAFLNEIVSKLEVLKASEILNHLRQYVINALHQSQEKLEGKDGMDIALCVFDFERMSLQYSGANNPVYVIREQELIILPADKMPIGISGEKRPFSNMDVPLRKGDMVYLFSDGFADQFGGSDDKKFLVKNFKQMLIDVSDYALDKQKFLIEKRLLDWQGDYEQIDDIMIIGIRI